MSVDEAIRLEQAAKQYDAHWGLAPTDLIIATGAFVLLAGDNGAGKSTLLRLLAGLCKPSRGRVLILGQEPHSSSMARASIGLLAHQTLLYDDLTARENLLFYARLYALPQRQARVDEMLDQMGLMQRQHHRVGNFSRGMKQRLALARASLHRPSLLLFDEPFTGLDASAVTHLRSQLAHFKEQGCTVLVVTHRPETVLQLVDYLVILRQGRVDYQAPWSGDMDGFQAVYQGQESKKL